MSSNSKPYILIAPIDSYEPATLDHLCLEIHQLFDIETQINQVIESIEFAFDPTRRQYHSTAILEQLTPKAPRSALKVLAITQKDLFIPILTHVFGEAQLGGTSCIISTFRLQNGIPPLNVQLTILNRMVKEAAHELGHTFNIRHCQDPACIMRYCRSEGDVDRKSDQFCRYCRTLMDDERRRLFS
jgi:archaemetzincin